MKEEVGGDRRKPGPLTDRILMRTKDFIIIGTAALALIKWFLVNPIQTQDRVSRSEKIQMKQQETLEKIATNLEIQTRKLGDIETRFFEFQKSFYSKRPGGWISEDKRWKWSGHGDGQP